MGQSPEELSTQIAGTRQSLASDLDALQDRVSPAAIVERRKEAARDRATSIRHRVMGQTTSAKDNASSAKDSVADSASNLKGSTGDAIQGNPLAAGLVAFGAGLVIAALIPPSEAEINASQKVVETAKEKGQPLVEEAKSVGQDVGANLKESAMDSAQQVKESATDSASRVQGEGQASAETVRSQAPGQS